MLFLRESGKNQFSSRRFRGFWNGDLTTTSLTNFHKSVHVLFKKRHVSDCQKENLICSNNAPEIHIFNSLRHQKLLLAANQLQDSTFLFDINSKGTVISKLVSQFKLLASLFELEDNDTIIVSTIRKDCKVFKLSQANRCRKWRYLFCFEARKNIPQVNYGKPHVETTDCTL